MKAVIFWGGWDGHQPEQVANHFANLLAREGFAVEVFNRLEILSRVHWPEVDLVVPCWTMGEIPDAVLQQICGAVERGAGIAGCHGGMCDAFRTATEWQFMTGGQWVSHPGNDGVNYKVEIRDGSHPVTKGIEDFEVCSEQYYMHVDPAVEVLATTRFPIAGGPHASNGPVDMPVIWTKMYGQGRVFYCSLGHQASILEAEPVQEIMRRGMCWAARQMVPAT